MSAALRSVRATLMRGGTSKGLVFRESALPPHGPARDRVVLGAVRPDPTGMQLDGTGGGVSSTSKVVIVGPSEQPGADVDYTFGQVSLREQKVEWDQSCGNLSAAAGLFAVLEGLVARAPGETTRVNVWQTNTRSRMVIHVPPADAAERISIPGVPGVGPPLYVEWVRPDVGRSGPVVERLAWRGGEVEASLVQCGNPSVVVRAADLGLEGMSTPLPWPEIDDLRAQAAERLGIELSSATRVVLVGPPEDYTCSDGGRVSAADVDLCARITTDGHRVHHAFTGTGSINLAAVSAVPGSVPAQVRVGAGGKLRLGHPGGTMVVQADVEVSPDGWRTRGAGFLRTSRRIMAGEVFLPEDE